ncbi:MAG: hypothetical protein RL748_2023, partial [Pseudomonadota bacterium]
KIVVLEAADHIGGRLLSVTPPDIPGMVAELGGMRILQNAQPLIVKLIADLNDQLTPDQQIETYPFPVDEPQNLAFLRGQYLRLADFTTRPDKVPYKLSFLETGNSPGGVIVNAIEQIVPGITDPSLTEDQRRRMARDAEFAGKPLYQQGFWNVLARVLSGEGYRFGEDAGGYNSTLSNWNAADAIPWYLSDFGITPEYKGFCKGFQGVPLTLASLFEKLGGEIRLDTKVDGFDHSHGKFSLQIGRESLQADTLILAMPRRSLELLTPTSPPLNPPAVQKLIGSVTPRPLFKLFTTYAYPWWRAAGYTDAKGKAFPVQSGRTVTDLPVRQTYYWPNSNGSPATHGPAMLLASYDDGTNIGFWDGLRSKRSLAWQKAGGYVPENSFDGELCAKNQDMNWFQHRAPQPMVQEVARQLQQIHDLDYTPPVRNAAYRDWGADPFGGGWNSWNIGVKSAEVIRQIVQPGSKLPMFICGEAYSDAQGWVEGALQTADLVLAKL